MKKTIAVATAVVALVFSHAAHASAVGLFDFGTEVGTGWTITEQTVVAQINTPSSTYEQSGSGNVIALNLGPANGGSASFDSAAMFGTGTFLRLTDSPTGIGPEADIVVLEEWTAEIDIAPGGSFLASPLVGLTYDNLDPSADPATNFAKATVSVYANTGADIVSNSQSVFVDSSSKISDPDIQAINALYKNDTDHDVTATFTMTGEISIQTVPEPASIALALPCLGMLVWFARRRKD